MSKAKNFLMTYLEVMIVYIILCALLVLGSAATLPLGLWGTVLTELAMLAAAVLVSRVRQDAFEINFPLKSTPPRNFLNAVWLAFGGYFLISAVTCFISAFVPEYTNTTDVLMYENYMKDSSPIVVVISIVAVPAFCEEMLFRGYFLNKLMRTHKSPVIPILVSSLLFGILHFDLYKLPITTLMGVVLGYLAWKTGSVLLPVIFHMINNAMSVVSLYSTYSASAGEQLYTVIEPGSYLAVGVMMFGIAAGPIFSGLRRFGTIRPKKWMRILCPILCIIIVVAASFSLSMSISDVVLNTTDLVEYPDAAEHTAVFTVDEYRYCNIALSAYSGYGVDANFLLTDAEGNILYELVGENCSGGTELILMPGEYTITCTLAPGENNTTGKFDVIISEQVIGTYKIVGTDAQSSDTSASDTGQA